MKRQIYKNLKMIVQQVTGDFLYYSISVNSKMLVALSTIASEQGNLTNTTMNKVENFLNYVVSHQDAIVMYHASEMILACYSDALYLSEPKARSRVGDNFFILENDEIPRKNGAVLNITQIIKVAMTSTAEA